MKLSLGVLCVALVLSAAPPDVPAEGPAYSRPGTTRIVASLAEALPQPGSPVLLVFFTVDCPSCFGELFEARYFLDKGNWPVEVVGVSSAPRDILEPLLEKFAWTRPVVSDRRKVLFRTYRVDMVPHAVLLAGGTTLYEDDPYADRSRRREDLKKCLEKLFSR
jgi:peroxiredoxin